MIRLKKDGVDFLAAQLRRTGNDIHPLDPDDIELNDILDNLVGDGLNGYRMYINQVEAQKFPSIILSRDGVRVASIYDNDYLVITRDKSFIDIVNENDLRNNFCLIISDRVFRVLLWLEKWRSKHCNEVMIRHANKEVGLN